ncbi:MAG: flagellar basal body P-ring formation chaperone FlgA [Phycisphaerae bacterium]
MKLGRQVGIAVVMMVLGASCAFGEVIHLESRAVVNRGEDVRLGNIATITGADEATAARLADIVVMSDVESDKKVSADSVLMAISAQLGAGRVAQQLEVSGAATVEVVVGEGAGNSAFRIQNSEGRAGGKGVVAGGSEQQQGAMPVVLASAGSSAEGADAQVEGVETVTGETLGELIVDEVGEALGVSKEGYRVRFDSVNPLLNEAAPAGARWEVRALTQSTLGTLPFSAELMQGPRVLKRTMVQAIAEKKTTVLCATSQIHVKGVVTKDQFRTQEVWLDRNMPTLFSNAADVVGLEAQRELMAGSMLDQRDFKPVMMANTGDVITVVFVAGALKVQMTGRAQASGKLHDMIGVRNEATGQEYQATLIGKSLAVIGPTPDEATEKKLRETR